MHALTKAGVLGAGMMGAEIALSFAMSGYEVVMTDISLELAEKGKSHLNRSLDRKIKKGTFKKEKMDSTLSRIIPVADYDRLKDADLVIEAISEDLEIKQKAFAAIDKICKPECVFATNTSSLPVTKLARSVSQDRISNFIGTHFFLPPR